MSAESGYESLSQQTDPSDSQSPLVSEKEALGSRSPQLEEKKTTDGSSLQQEESEEKMEVDHETKEDSETQPPKPQSVEGAQSDSPDIPVPAIPSLMPEDMSIQELHAKVKALFPGFKPNGILRFSSLLGLGKPSSLPRLWQEAQKPRRKKREDREAPKEWKMDFDENYVPPPEMCLDDEVSNQFYFSKVFVENVSLHSDVLSYITYFYIL